MYTTYGKAQVIAASKRIDKSSCSNMWMVEGSKKGSFHVEQYIEEAKELLRSCEAFAYGVTVPCKHAIAVSLLEVS
jgi:hypothetical protein